MRFIEHLKVTKCDWLEKDVMKRIFPIDIELKEFTVIVGENQSGKTTLFKCIGGKSWDRDIDAHKSDLKVKKSVESFNCRLFTDKDIKSQGTFTGDPLQLLKYSMSNGETQYILIDRIERSLQEMESCVICMDEFDFGLDFKHQIESYNRLYPFVEKGFQFIIITHSAGFISQCADVYDMTNKVWTTGREYLKRELGL